MAADRAVVTAGAALASVSGRATLGRLIADPSIETLPC